MTLAEMDALGAATWAYVYSADFAGMLFGVLGTMLLAVKARAAGWSFAIFLASNVGWMAFAYQHNIDKLLIQHAVFAITSVIGVWVWLLRPVLHRVLNQLSHPYLDTHTRDDEIFRRFTGRNAAQLAYEFDCETGEVYDIVYSRGGVAAFAATRRRQRSLHEGV